MIIGRNAEIEVSFSQKHHQVFGHVWLSLLLPDLVLFKFFACNHTLWSLSVWGWLSTSTELVQVFSKWRQLWVRLRLLRWAFHRCIRALFCLTLISVRDGLRLLFEKIVAPWETDWLSIRTLIRISAKILVLDKDSDLDSNWKWKRINQILTSVAMLEITNSLALLLSTY